MIIQHNMQAMNANRMLGGIVTSQSKVTEKLSSGYRINRAGDDAAGLSISEKMRSQIRGLDRASTNAQDAISLIQTAEGALTETHSILQRMRELAVQAATDTNVEEDREAVQAEIEQLTSEINRIAKTTEFNGMKLLNGEKSNKNDVLTEASTTTDPTIKKGVIGDLAAAKGVTNPGYVLGGLADGDNTIKFTASDDINWTDLDSTAGKSQVTLTKKSDSAGDYIEVAIAVQEKTTATNKLTVTDKLYADESGNFIYGSHGMSFTITKENFEKLNANDALVVDLGAQVATVGTDPADATNTTYAVDSDYSTKAPGKCLAINDLEVTAANEVSFENLQIKVGSTAGGVYTIDVIDADSSEVIDKIEYTDTTSGAGDTVFTYDSHGIKFNLDLTAAVAADSLDTTINLKDKLGVDENATTTETTYKDNSLYFQVGANANQIINVSLEDMSAAALGITSASEAEGFSDEMSVAADGVTAKGTEYALDLTNRENANNAITKIDDAIKSVSKQRSALGAVQNRLEHTIANLDTSAENLQAAESRIRDVDMASEMVTYSKNNILQQAAQSMLAQANQSTQGVLSLLQ